MNVPRFASNTELVAMLNDRLPGDLDEAHQGLLKLIESYGGQVPSQLYQDLWVLLETDNQRDGFFVEIGATDGVALSNTLLLEQSFDWRGILCEPNDAWHEQLRLNRPAAAIVTECVWSRSGELLPFTADGATEFGTIEAFAKMDMHGDRRRAFQSKFVPTVSLNDLLKENQAPNDIDFVSIDTEGSELEILQAIDFDRWNIRLFAIEHNFTPNEHSIDVFMQRNGYERRFVQVSRHDAWYRRVS